jgi:hypothetical protein
MTAADYDKLLTSWAECRALLTSERNQVSANERLLETISAKLQDLRAYVDTAPFLLESAIIERIDVVLSTYAERKGE